MANGIFNIALGKIAYYSGLPAASDSMQVVLLQSGAQADDTLNNHVTLAAVLGANTEATFQNYVRKAATGALNTINNTSNLVDVDIDDITWANAGPTPNNTLAKLLICYKPDAASADAAIIPLTHHDFSVTTDGSSITAQVAANGFFRATQ